MSGAVREVAHPWSVAGLLLRRTRDGRGVAPLLGIPSMTDPGAARDTLRLLAFRIRCTPPRAHSITRARMTQGIVARLHPTSTSPIATRVPPRGRHRVTIPLRPVEVEVEVDITRTNSKEQNQILSKHLPRPLLLHRLPPPQLRRILALAPSPAA